MEPPVAHWRFRIDVAGLGEPVDCLLLATDLVGKLKRNCLPAGKDAAVGNPIQVFAFEPTPVPYNILEPRIGIDHQRLDCSAGFRSGRLKAIWSGLEGGGLYLLKLDADLGEQVGEIRILERRRLVVIDGYSEDEQIVKEVMRKRPLNRQELKYIDALLEQPNIEEEDAELILTIMRDHAQRVEKRLPYILAT